MQTTEKNKENLMKIFRNLDPRENRLPKETDIIKKPRHRKVPFVDPNFYIRTNPRMAENLAQFDPIKPAAIRAKARAKIAQQVEMINRHIKDSQLFKGIRFEVDEESGRSFAVVKNQRTGELLKQFPSDESLDRAARLRDFSGLMKDITV